MIKQMIIVVLLIIPLLSIAQAANPVPVTSGETCYQKRVERLALVVEEGIIQWCVYKPDGVIDRDSEFYLTQISSTPPPLSGSGVTISPVVPVLRGDCALVDAAVVSTLSSHGGGPESSRRDLIRMTGNECHILLQLRITASSTTLFEGFMTINVARTPGILDALAIWLPLALFALMIFWAETGRDWIIYATTAALALYNLVNLWADFTDLRLGLIIITLLVIMRTITLWESSRRAVTED